MCCCLGHIAKHSVDLAEMVVEAEIFPKILTCLKYPDELVRKNSATVIREVCKHTPELAQLVVSNGSVGALVDYIGESQGGFSVIKSRKLYFPSTEFTPFPFFACLCIKHWLATSTTVKRKKCVCMQEGKPFS